MARLGAGAEIGFPGASGLRGSVRHLRACKQWVGNCQPWFYLRLAPQRGTIALLDYPREHTVPRETLRLNPAWILTLEPERSATAGLRHPTEGWFRVPRTVRAQAACSFRCSGLNLSPFFQIFSVMAAILRASVRRAISGRMPLASSPR